MAPVRRQVEAVGARLSVLFELVTSRAVSALTPLAGQVYSLSLDDLRLVGGKERYARPVRDNRRSGGDRLAARPAR
jgi:hypothetical protein